MNQDGIVRSVVQQLDEDVSIGPEASRPGSDADSVSQPGSDRNSLTARSAYRMIAIDLDGTLLSPTGRVSARTRQAVRSAVARGFRVCFATGRNWTESRSILDDVGHFDIAVFVGGAMVVDTRQRIVLHRTMMHPDLARGVCAALESMGHAVCALQDTGSAGVDYLVSEQSPVNAATQQWLKVTSAAIRRVPSLADHDHPHTVRVGIVAGPVEIAEVKRELVRRFGDRALCQSLFVPAYDVEVMEVFDPAVNKWQGVLFAARRWGIEPGQIIAVGDDVNDISMLSEAGLGVAMGNARPEVIAVADRVIASNADDGLAGFLEELTAPSDASRN